MVVLSAETPASQGNVAHAEERWCRRHRGGLVSILRCCDFGTLPVCMQGEYEPSAKGTQLQLRLHLKVEKGWSRIWAPCCSFGALSASMQSMNERAFSEKIAAAAYPFTNSIFTNPALALPRSYPSHTSALHRIYISPAPTLVPLCVLQRFCFMNCFSMCVWTLFVGCSLLLRCQDAIPRNFAT